MPILLWDACGLVKRYVAEIGSETTNALFSHVPSPTMICTFWGCTEMYAIFIRRLNSGRMNASELNTAVSALYNEIVHSQDFDLLSISDDMVMASFTHIRAHNINSADTALLTTFLRYKIGLPEGSPVCISNGGFAPSSGSTGRRLADAEPGSDDTRTSDCFSRFIELTHDEPATAFYWTRRS